MIKIRKNICIVFSIVLLNILSIFYFPEFGSAKQISAVQTNNQFNSFTYDVNLPISNNSFANRIATENFEYESNLNLSNFGRWSDNKFSLVVKDFNDIDFSATNFTYKSKYAELTSLRTGTNYYYYQSNFLNDYAFESVRARFIVKPLDLMALNMRFYFKSLKYITISIDYSTTTTRNMVIFNGSTVLKTYINFLPLRSQYQYLYLEFDKVLPETNHTIQIKVYTYNQTGAIKSYNQTQYKLENYKTEKMHNFYLIFGLTGANKKCNLIAIDTNFETNRFAKNQYAIFNGYYESTDLRRFYLTLVPFYTNNLRSSISNRYYYANTILKNRYLAYKTNASNYAIPNTNAFNDETNDRLSTSFSMRLELGTNASVNNLQLNFNKSNYLFEVINTVILGVTYKYISFNGTYIPLGTVNDNRIILLIQFRNKFLTTTLLLNQTIYYFEYYLNDNFEKIQFSGFQLLNSEIKTLTSSNIIYFANNTFLRISSDILTFKERVYEISVYNQFESVIYIQPTTITHITDSDNRLYDVYSSKIISMNFLFNRDSLNGEFSITSDNEITLGIFNLLYDLNDSLNYNFLNNKDSGKLYIKSKFYTTSEPQIIFNISISYVRLLLFTDQIPENNLLIAKALEIFIPIVILGVIVIGFKSNSKSKYFGFIGLYVGIFTLYLMEYMSLLFMILAFLIQTIGLYIIIKWEKSDRSDI